MKVALTFDLPDEKDDLLHALNGQLYAATLFDLDQAMRAHLKYGTPLDVENLRRELHDGLISTPWQD